MNKLDNLFEINLTPFNIKKNAFHQKMTEIISKNNGWVNFQKGIFDTEVERDYALFELEREFGIDGREIKNLSHDAKMLYQVFIEMNPKKNISNKDKKALKDSFLEILMLDEYEINELLKLSNTFLSSQNRALYFKELKKIQNYEPFQYQRFLKIKSIDDKINKIFEPSPHN